MSLQKQSVQVQVNHWHATVPSAATAQAIHTRDKSPGSVFLSFPRSNAFRRPSRKREASGPLRERHTEPTPKAAGEALATSCCGEHRQGEAAAPTTSLRIGADTPPLPHTGRPALPIGSARGHRAFLAGELGVSSAGGGSGNPVSLCGKLKFLSM